MTHHHFDLTVFIGRFSPFHKGHEAVLRKAFEHSSHVLVLVGSANRPLTFRNPFSADTRHAMIRSVFADKTKSELVICSLNDHTYQDQRWMEEVQGHIKTTINNLGLSLRGTSEPKVALIGHQKDASSYYLNMFPQFDENIGVEPMLYNGKVINATDIREHYMNQFRNAEVKHIKAEFNCVMSEGAAEYLFIMNSEYLYEEYKWVRDYKRKWEHMQYGHIDNTVDAVVIHSGHVLLVERGGWPGKGLLALPGGFLNPGETQRAAMLRELREETRLRVPKAMLEGNIKLERTFDAVHRSERGRTITQAFMIELPNGPLWEVKGADDAKKAFWLPLGDLDSNKMFEDHYDIIQVMRNGRK